MQIGESPSPLIFDRQYANAFHALLFIAYNLLLNGAHCVEVYDWGFSKEDVFLTLAAFLDFLGATFCGAQDGGTTAASERAFVENCVANFQTHSAELAARRDGSWTEEAKNRLNAVLHEKFIRGILKGVRNIV